MKIRIKFSKQGAMKFIGHLDVMRYFQKVMRQANVNIRYSEGFSPHQIMSFAAPLGVGLTSQSEYVDIEVLSTDSSRSMLQRINEAMVDGFTALSYKLLPETAGNAMSIVAAADYVLTFRAGYEPDDWVAFASGFTEFLQQDQIVVLKKTKKGEKEMDIRPMIYAMEIKGDQIWLRVATGSTANLKPDLVIRAYLESSLYAAQKTNSEAVDQTLSEFALQTERLEVYANLGTESSPVLKALDQLGEDLE